MATTEGSIEKVVESAVRAQVSQMVVQSLEGVDGLTARIVAGALQSPVRDQRSYRDIPFIEKLAKDAITQAAQEAITAWIDENRDALRKEVARQLTANKDNIAASMIQSFTEAASSIYRMSVVFETPRDGG